MQPSRETPPLPPLAPGEPAAGSGSAPGGVVIQYRVGEFSDDWVIPEGPPPRRMPIQEPPRTPPELRAQPPEGEGVLIKYRITTFSDDWVIDERPMSEGVWHFRARVMLHTVLDRWIRDTRRDAAVFSDLAVRIQHERPQVGIDPDVSVVEPAPPGASMLQSLRLWEPGHSVPTFVVEMVSPSNPYKDYVVIPEQCGLLGVGELVVFDPMLVGPRAGGGPFRLQLWRRLATGEFARAAAGPGPLFSEFLGAHLVPMEGPCLRISNDPAGQDLWLTPEEAERAEKEAERAELGRARARIAELEAELATRRGR